MMKMKKNGILFLSLLTLFLLMTGCGKGEVRESGSVAFTVLDGVTGLPIEGVKLVIPETGESVMTDSNGQTTRLTVPVMRDDRFDRTVPEDSGTFTVLGYKENYNRYALFFARLHEGEERRLKLYLFSLQTPLSGRKPLTTVESPDSGWVNQLLDKYE